MNKDKVYLVQTDTTVGFLSANDKSLCEVKQRDLSKRILQVVDSLDTLKQNTRIPNKFKNKVRRSKKTTYIYPNTNSYRVIHKNDSHYNFISKFSKMYSTSANLSGSKYDSEFALANADVIVEDNRGFNEKTPSKIYKINNQKIKKIRG